jgi:hypothetical protein
MFREVVFGHHIRVGLAEGEEKLAAKEGPGRIKETLSDEGARALPRLTPPAPHCRRSFATRPLTGSTVRASCRISF